jgi:hypothetical protein
MNKIVAKKNDRIPFFTLPVRENGKSKDCQMGLYVWIDEGPYESFTLLSYLDREALKLALRRKSVRDKIHGAEMLICILHL